MNADFLFVDSGGRYEKIALLTLIYITGNSKATYFFTNAGVIVSPLPLRNFERYLFSGNQFCRIHDTHIVALNKIISFDAHSVLMPGALLPLARKYEPVLRNSVRILDELPQDERRSSWWVDEKGRVKGEW